MRRAFEALNSPKALSENEFFRLAEAGQRLDGGVEGITLGDAAALLDVDARLRGKYVAHDENETAAVA